MSDTAQPLAAETDPFADAATAFKVSLGQEEAKPLPERGDDGRFKASDPDPDEQEPEPAPDMVEDDDEAGEVEQPGAESEEDEGEAQQDATPMPTSWPKEQEEQWASLPVETQAFIAEREAQRDHAIGQKFQEAANIRKASETIAEAAQSSRLEFIQAVDQITSLILPTEPPLTMLDASSGDYNPDGYHLLKAQHDRALSIVGTLQQQRQQTAAQYAQEAQQHEKARFDQLHTATVPALLKDVPDLADKSKASGILGELMEYAIGMGAPNEMFQSPTTALEWHVLWKAREYDRLQAATGEVRKNPPPAKKPQPPIRPGVTTPRSATRRAQQAKDFERLSQSGSIEDGAAVFKHFMKS